MESPSPRETFEDLMKVGFAVGGLRQDVHNRSSARSQHLEERTGKLAIMRATEESQKRMIMEYLAMHFGLDLVRRR